MSFNCFIGVDPGKSGALMALGSDRSIWAQALMGTLQDTIDFFLMFSESRVFVMIEKAQAMPKNGSVAMFNYGQGFGEILGALAALKLPYAMVPPRTWTAQMCAGIPQSMKPKDRAARAVEQLFPGINFGKTTKLQREGLHDALLISEYARLKYAV